MKKIRIKKGSPVVIYIVTRREDSGLFVPVASFFSAEKAEAYVKRHLHTRRYSIDALHLPFTPDRMTEEDGDYYLISADESAFDELWSNVMEEP